MTPAQQQNAEKEFIQRWTGNGYEKGDSGYSVRNLKYMRQFAEEYPDFPFVQVPLAQLQELPILAAKSRANIKYLHFSCTKFGQFKKSSNFAGGNIKFN